VSNGRFSNLEMGGGGPAAGQGGGVTAVSASPVTPGNRANPFATELKDAAFHLRSAIRHELAGNFEEALRDYAVALGENPLLPEAWSGQLWVLLELGEYPEARLWADKALERFPESPDLLAAKSVALYRMGLAEDARALNDAALQKKGESALVWLCRGEIMLTSSRAAGEECLARALRIASPDDATLVRAAGVAMRLHSFSLAMSFLQQAVTRHPDAARAWYLQGRMQESLGQFAVAEISFRQAAGLAPDNRAYRQLLPYQRPGVVARFRAWLRQVTGS